ncbi:MAG: bifunctional phosphoribosylaminoimidazolecarboxamide formyltransferase/IMP cyclohydrolase [Anaerovoracaceae bacterium]
MRALISVSDKTGVVEFARELEAMGYEIISTGGTCKLLKESGVDVQEVSSITGFPECLDGRVKTLHPKIHGGILARRDMKTHMDKLNELEITPIDIVAINLYPFKETIRKENVTIEDAIENIDIGGPAMLRSSAKNHKDVIVVCQPADYPLIIDSLKNSEGKDLSYEIRKELAIKVYRHTAAYDAMISDYLYKSTLDNLSEETTKENETISNRKEKTEFQDEYTVTFEKVQELRYGENSHQSAAYYKEIMPGKLDLVNAVQLHGKELSFNNINDVNAALECLKEFEETAVVAVKHANPCGVAVADTVLEAYLKAHDCDPISIFGGIVVTNRTLDAKTAAEINKIFVEIVLAPGYEEEAFKILSKKENIRIMELKGLGEKTMSTPALTSLDIKKISGGILLQDPDVTLKSELKTVTKKQITEQEKKDLLIALKVVKHTKSNGIVFVKNGMTIGIGPGQTNRIWAVRNAISQSNFDTKGAVMASDAFFPFSDCVEAAAAAGVTAIIQPGGSIKDQESIDKADELGLAMVFSGLRHFKH